MKRTKMLLISALALCLLCGLSACGSKPPQLSGTYSATTYGTTMRYTFEDDAVTAQYFMMGFEIAKYEGTYAINDEETQITLSFDPAQIENATLPTGLTSLGGTFTFQRGEGYIVIGGVRYDQSNGTEPTPPVWEATPPMREVTPAPSMEDADPALREIHLALPEEYEIQYQVTETAGFSRTYTQTMTKTKDGFYFDFGDTGERYVFALREDGGYTQYLYHAAQGGFVPSNTPVVPSMIDGYAARVTSYFDFYETCRGNMAYQGREDIGSWDCQKYTSEITTLTGTQGVELWIEPETGLCVKAAYQVNAAAGGTGTKTVECTRFSTEGVALPSYS